MKKRGKLLALALAVSTAFTMLAPSTGLIEAGTVRAEQEQKYDFTVTSNIKGDVTSGATISVGAAKVTDKLSVELTTGGAARLNAEVVSGAGVSVSAEIVDKKSYAKVDGSGHLSTTDKKVNIDVTIDANTSTEKREADVKLTVGDFVYTVKYEQAGKSTGGSVGRTFAITSGSYANVTASSADISFYANELGTYTYTVSTDGKEIAKSETAGKIESVTKATTFKVSDLDSDTKYTVTINGVSNDGDKATETVTFTTAKSSGGGNGSSGGSGSNSTTVKNADGSTTTTTKTANGTVTTTTKTNADGSKSTKKVVANKDGSGSVTETTVSAKGTTKSVEVVTDTTGAVTEVSTTVSNAKGVSMSASYKANGTKLTLSKIETEGKTAVTIPATVKCDGKTYKVTKIGTGAMSGNKEIKTVTLGKNITVIGKNAFKGDSKLKTINFKKAPTKVGKNAFKGISKKAVIKIKATKKAFKAAKKLIKKSGIASTVKIKRVK